METRMKLAGSMIAMAIVSVAVVGCGKSQSAKAAAEQLQKSFEKADPLLKQQVAEVSTAFQSSNYNQAINIMHRVVQTQPVDEAQKQAVDALIIQTRQAIQQNPKLDSPELYKAMSDLFVQVHGEN